MWLALGCEFEKTLTNGEAVRLGLTGDSFNAEGAAHLIEIACDD